MFAREVDVRTPSPDFSRDMGEELAPEKTTPVPECVAKPKSVASASTREEESLADSSTDDGSASALPERPPVPNDLAGALCSLSRESQPYVYEALLRYALPERVQDFALALYSAASPEMVKPVADLIGALQPSFGGVNHTDVLGHKVWEYCQEDLPHIAGDAPPERAHGTILLASELFVRGIISLAAVKELFAVLLFSESHPADHAVSLSCHVFLIVGPFLERTAVGARMVEFLVLRLKEVKGLNLTIATRQSITDVVELQKCRWDASRIGSTRERSSGQKKARAAARLRARALIERVHNRAEDAWAGLSNDARALTALIEFAASCDPAAEAALATAPKELHETLRVVATPETLGYVQALCAQSA
jgi:hypothetical protein